MAQKRRQFNMQHKFTTALEAVKGIKTINQIAAERSLHPNQVSTWKKQLLEEGSTIFSRRANSEAKAQASRETELFEQIGRLKMELEWLKKKSATFN